MKTYTKAERQELTRLTVMLKAIDPFRAAHVDRILQIDGLMSECTLSPDYESVLAQERSDRMERLFSS